MREFSPEYLAGFFDGEGHVSICRSRVKPNRRLTYWLVAGVCCTDPGPVLEFKRRFGGTIHLRPRRSEKWSRTTDWLARNRVAERFLQAMLPYLIVKRKDAEIGLQFQRVIRPYTKAGHRRHALTNEEIGVREEVRTQMLQKHGTAARAPVEVQED